jgi:hypothetical protein
MRFKIAIVLLFLSGSLLAGEVNESGGYIGLIAGASTLEDDGLFNNTNFDDGDTSVGIYGGYKFLKYFALEGRLLNLGSYQIESFELELAAFTINAVGIIPFGNSGWELFGQLGFGTVNIDAGFDDEDESIGSAGLGVKFTPIKQMSIAFQIDAYAYEEDSFSQTYDVGVVTTQLAIQYNF